MYTFVLNPSRILLNYCYKLCPLYLCITLTHTHIHTHTHTHTHTHVGEDLTGR